jgi:hypothetical protein
VCKRGGGEGESERETERERGGDKKREIKHNSLLNIYIIYVLYKYI